MLIIGLPGILFKLSELFAIVYAPRRIPNASGPLQKYHLKTYPYKPLPGLVG
ncbi:hypothetical protein DOT_3582 [Desulfosporosinus sp. OT]|nr:hypothetical protein DOT_3582 [Desulfosporosinus sp. OT]